MLGGTVTPSNDPLYELLVRSQKCEKAMSSLVKRFGVESCEWALNRVRAEHIENNRSGRKKDFDLAALRDVWIFVESGKLQTRQSANAFCKRAIFRWASIGLGGRKITKEVSGETLRRRYQQAVAFLEEETESTRKLAKMRGEDPSQAVSEVEKWWRRALADQLPALCGKAA